MEIIARLREERQALVARVAQIDKMLRQYEEWGREAQRLLSPATVIQASPATAPISSSTTEESVRAPISEGEQATGSAPDVPTQRVSGGIVRRTSFPATTRKTPMKEFLAAVIDVLRQSNRPMDRVALYDALTARGIVIGDGDRDKELNSLSARVYRMAQDPNNRISSERGQGYSLMADDETSDADAADDAPADEQAHNDLI